MSTSGQMQAVHFSKPGDASVLSLTTCPIPSLDTPYDILVQIKACSLNPVDTKAREGAFPTAPVLGYDGAGIVTKAGSAALFQPGDAVMFSGVLGRSGTNAQYAVVDSRIAGRTPKGWSWTDAAGLPLVGVTAWEMFELHFNLKPFEKTAKEETLLIVNGAGGVGSMATQLASKVFNIKTIIVTASRPETIEWAKKNGATHVINHHKDIAEQLKSLNLTLSMAFICYGTVQYLETICKSMRPWGRIGSIVEGDDPLPFHTMDAFSRALSFHWEFMFSRPLNGYEIEVQGRILGDLARAAEEGKVTSMAKTREVLSADSLRKMHEFVESGKAIGKIVFEVKDTIGEK